MKQRLFWLMVVLGLGLSDAAVAQQINEDFVVVVPPGWTATNHSEPLGALGWFQGNSAVFPSQAGAATAYAGVNFNSTGGPTGIGTISNWLITPQVDLANGETFSFWTRTVAASPFPDRLQVRLSTSGASTDVGTTSADVGVFTTLLLDINPNLTVGGYPEAWTQSTINLSGLPAGVTSGRIAFRYFVTEGGPQGDNSNYIGVDTVSLTVPPPGAGRYFTLAPCRVIDTRGNAAPIQGPVMNGQETRSFTMTGHCSIPASARALSVNVTATASTAAGFVTLFPSGTTMPLVSNINYALGQTRGNNAIVLLNGTGAMSAFIGQGAGTTVHLIVDVNGYFE